MWQRSQAPTFSTGVMKSLSLWTRVLQFVSTGASYYQIAAAKLSISKSYANYLKVPLSALVTDRRGVFFKISYFIYLHSPLKFLTLFPFPLSLRGCSPEYALPLGPQVLGGLGASSSTVARLR